MEALQAFQASVHQDEGDNPGEDIQVGILEDLDVVQLHSDTLVQVGHSRRVLVAHRVDQVAPGRPCSLTAAFAWGGQVAFVAMEVRELVQESVLRSSAE